MFCKLLATLFMAKTTTKLAELRPERSPNSLEKMLLEIIKVQKIQLESVLQDAVALQVKIGYILKKNSK